MSKIHSEEDLLMQRAGRTLKEAELLFENKYFNAAVNRIYYACFYAVKALLINKGIDARKHSGVKQMLGLHFVMPGTINKELGKFYTDIFEMRQEGDYEELIEFDRDDVVILFEPAKELIAQIEQFLSHGNE